ncbi:MAG: aminotransferase class III-fold pyridoxal phosphate-dependent enzyme, partial [Thermodesulfobacteriota bacterium]
MTKRRSHVLNVFMNQEYPAIVRGQGLHLWDDQGKRYIDASGGPMLCCLGHGLAEMAEVLGRQARELAYVYRLDFTTPVLEEAADKVCQATGGVADRVFFVSGGSEAIEIAVKVARKYQIDHGAPSKYKIVSRWQSYHGMTMGALSWSGFTFRRRDYVPYLADHSHIAPAYCYRCWFGLSPDRCGLECAKALENEILCQGPETVAAFLAEPFVGMALCAAGPPPDYFKLVREICDRYEVLLILDEVMTGFGRTGKWFGFEHFGVQPDILALGKGLGGGYFPIGAAAVSARVADTIAEKSGIFAAGFTWAGNPMGAAVVCRSYDYLREHHLVERCAQLGDYLAGKMERLREHPTVGDLRGVGLMRG